MKQVKSAVWNVWGYLVSFCIIFLLSLLNYSSFIVSIGWHFPSLESIARIALPLLILVLVVGFAIGVAMQIHLARRLKTEPPLHHLMSVFVFLASLVFWGFHLFGDGSAASKKMLLLSPIFYLLMMSLDLIVLRFAQSELLWRWEVGQRKLTVGLFNVALFIGLILTFESVFRLATHIRPYEENDYGTILLSPYVMFSEPDVDNGGWLNLQGFEGPMLPSPGEKAKREIRIAVLGGSAAWSGGRSKSIAAFLEQELKSHRSTEGFDIRVVNFGRQSYISMQELILLQRNVLPLGFDLIIVYDGFNDILVPRNAEPLGVGYPYLYSALKKRVERSQFINFPMALNALARKSSFATFVSKRGTARRGYPDPRFNLGKSLEEYKRNLTQMAVLGRAYEAKMIFITQPFVGTKKTRTEQEDRFLSPEEMLAMQSYYKELSAAGQEVARKTNSYYIYMLDVFDDMPRAVFYDSAHITIEEGNPIVARRIAQRLIAENLLSCSQGNC
jgi:hypothetical protein